VSSCHALYRFSAVPTTKCLCFTDKRRHCYLSSLAQDRKCVKCTCVCWRIAVHAWDYAEVTDEHMDMMEHEPEIEKLISSWLGMTGRRLCFRDKYSMYLYCNFLFLITSKHSRWRTVIYGICHPFYLGNHQSWQKMSLFGYPWCISQSEPWPHPPQGSASSQRPLHRKVLS
jgi:hypothetical protein